MAEKRQTESITFRIEKSILDNLREVAKRQKITPNSLAGQILGSHLEWELSAAAAGWISMPKSFLVEFMKLVDEKEMERIISKLSKEMAKDMDLYMRGKHDVESWLSIIRARSARSGFELTEYGEGNTLELVIQHDMGKKWSRYFKTFYENVFYDLGIKADFDYTENTLAIKLDTAGGPVSNRKV
ncbi:MAG: hypothetical protein KGI27_05240 [Thaumarchaeota archaeon]|nr:hypothetical protein [Nitrososphaerota archaeon]MDE1816749.1 hypothetical protein [Nitrososphaerota archaeon]